MHIPTHTAIPRPMLTWIHLFYNSMTEFSRSRSCTHKYHYAYCIHFCHFNIQEISQIKKIAKSTCNQLANIRRPCYKVYFPKMFCVLSIANLSILFPPNLILYLKIWIMCAANHFLSEDIIYLDVSDICGCYHEWRRRRLWL